MIQIINYAMTKDYRKEWGVVEAVRELVQNCLDNKDSKSTFMYNGGQIEITTRNFVLPIETFALGESQNKNNETIGGFGEGFKLALLVLEREEMFPVVTFGNKVVHTQFVDNDILLVPTFAVMLRESEYNVEHTTFKFLFPPDKFEELQHKVSVFADEPLVLEEDKNVTLLKDREGDILVDGLFICNEDNFGFGYNFAPYAVTLGSDRAIANPLGLSWQTSKYWADRLDSDCDEETLGMILDMIMREQLDIQNISYHISEESATEIAEEFTRRNGEVRINPNGYSGGGMSLGYNVNNTAYNVLRKGGIVNYVKDWEVEGTPYRLLEEFLTTNKKHIRRCAKKNLQSIIEQSKRWHA